VNKRMDRKIPEKDLKGGEKRKRGRMGKRSQGRRHEEGGGGKRETGKENHRCAQEAEPRLMWGGPVRDKGERKGKVS